MYNLNDDKYFIGVKAQMLAYQKAMQPLITSMNTIGFKQNILNAIEINNRAVQEACKIINNSYYTKSMEIINRSLESLRLPIVECMSQLKTIQWVNLINDYKYSMEGINFNNIKINDNGTIEYEEDTFTKYEIEETSNEIVDEIKTNGKVEISSILKKLIFSLIVTLLISFLQSEDLKYGFLLMFSGFWGQPGSDAYNFLKDKFKRIFKKENITNEYFENYSALIQIDNVKLRKKPNKKATVLRTLDFGNSVEITNQLGSWIEINYCIDEDNNTYISGWVYANSIKKINKIKNRLLN